MQLFEVYTLLTLFIVGFFLRRILRPHPLDQFSGPALARWTWLYRAYYDVVVGGGWLSHLKNLHEEFGPVVRVGRNELHFTDPAAYTEIYNSPYKMLKDPALYSKAFQLGLPPNSFTAVNPKDHSEIKSLISSYFSRKGILRLEHVVQERIDKLISQLLKNHRTSAANMNHAFRSVTLDIITLYTLRTSLDATSFPSFQHPAIIGVTNVIASAWPFKHFTTLKEIAIHLPSWLAVRMDPGLKANVEMNTQIEELVDKALRDSENEPNMNGHDDDDDSNVFYTITKNARIEGKLKQSSRVTRDWLIAEGANLRIAGSDTVGNTCTIGTRYLIKEDRVRIKLVQELENAWPDKGNPIPLERLEKLPYLTAVIKESLRLSIGVVTPMTRVVPDSGAVISNHPVPPGTIVSIGNYFVHMNPEIFPDPARFYPERWLEDKDHVLDRYLVTFGKGPRSCIGINLAWSELYMIFGNVFRKLEFRTLSIGLDHQEESYEKGCRSKNEQDDLELEEQDRELKNSQLRKATPFTESLQLAKVYRHLFVSIEGNNSTT
ncbi:benzoate 4-monooxygenase cytochrome p450 [Moniliophthora roreri MCA 2997]|uniref:Benzoate 4-monooxygenase cytochrome p450 n=1 Tax=Moniliophthora roreri (strain MCA 2997) TaxID=1381753 RepID=V2X444_MONRO|nr:benzoate 4-monooxygenase cytochrome p450 [Moniliophthora roreri MCA 2997]